MKQLPTMWLTIRNFALGGLFLAALAAMGCSGGAKGSVKGTVKKGDKKITSGKVTFLVGKENPVSGIIKDGTYEVTGVPVGEAIVLVESPKPAEHGDENMPGGGLEKMKDRAGKEMKAQLKQQQHIRDTWVPIPDKYKSQKTSGLKHTVKKGPDNEFNITIKED
jgi:hypothetical protein